MEPNQEIPQVNKINQPQVNTTMAVIAYLVFFIPLLTEDKNDPFVKFHVKQGVILFLAGILGNVAGGIIPILGWFLILPAVSLGYVIFMILGILNALNGKTEELPLIGKYASKLNF